MPFQVSPGVNVTEIDLTTIVPAVAAGSATQPKSRIGPAKTAPDAANLFAVIFDPAIFSPMYI